MDPLQGIKACVFDALGTLIDIATPLETARDELVKDGVDKAKLEQIIGQARSQDVSNRRR